MGCAGDSGAPGWAAPGWEDLPDRAARGALAFLAILVLFRVLVGLGVKVRAGVPKVAVITPMGVFEGVSGIGLALAGIGLALAGIGVGLAGIKLARARAVGLAGIVAVMVGAAADTPLPRTMFIPMIATPTRIIRPAPMLNRPLHVGPTIG